MVKQIILGALRIDEELHHLMMKSIDSHNQYNRMKMTKADFLRIALEDFAIKLLGKYTVVKDCAGTVKSIGMLKK